MKWNRKMQWYAKTIRAFRRQANNGRLIVQIEVEFRDILSILLRLKKGGTTKVEKKVLKMRKRCDSCMYYAPKYYFCGKLCIKVGRNLVEYCKHYKPKSMKG